MSLICESCGKKKERLLIYKGKFLCSLCVCDYKRSLGVEEVKKKRTMSAATKEALVQRLERARKVRKGSKLVLAAFEIIKEHPDWDDQKVAELLNCKFPERKNPVTKYYIPYYRQRLGLEKNEAGKK